MKHLQKPGIRKQSSFWCCVPSYVDRLTLSRVKPRAGWNLAPRWEHTDSDREFDSIAVESRLEPVGSVCGIIKQLPWLEPMRSSAPWCRPRGLDGFMQILLARFLGCQTLHDNGTGRERLAWFWNLCKNQTRMFNWRPNVVHDTNRDMLKKIWEHTKMSLPLPADIPEMF